MSFINLDEIPVIELIPGFNASLHHSEELTFGRVKIAAGAELPEHAHPHEQFTLILSGKLEFRIGGAQAILGPGMVAHMPPNVPHSAKAIEDCVVFDCFRPVREDLKAMQ